MPPNDIKTREKPGPHTGPRISALPIRDLGDRKGGAWKVNRVNWKKSDIHRVDGDDVIRVTYEKNSGTSRDPGVGGIDITAAPKGFPSDSVVVGFDLFFCPGWEFARGGKLVGISVGHGPASGYRHSDTGASHRIMWQGDGGAITYIYPPSNLPQEDPKLKAEGHGVGYFHDIFKSGTLKVNQWNHIEIGIKLNSFRGSKPNADGVATLTVNGKSGEVSNIRWRRSPDLDITSFNIGTFFGGPTPAPKDCTAYFKNIEIFEWK